MPDRNKKVLIITVSYNSSEFLERCLTTALEQDGYITVCLVDNNSKDNTLDIARKVKEKYPQLEILENLENSGFAGGNNLAIEKFRENHDYFYFHNPDAYLKDQNTISELVKVMEILNDEAIIQPMVYYPDGELGTSGNLPFYLGLGGMGTKLPSREKHYSKIGYTSGAALLISKKVIDKIGILDHLYFAYHEDLEISLRARLAGFENYVAPNIKVFHEHNFSKGSFKFYLMERNRWYLLYTYYDWFSIIFLIPPLLLLELMTTAYFFLNGWFGLRFKVYRDIWKARNELKQRKIDLQKYRSKESVMNLYKNFSGRLPTRELRKTSVLGFLVDLGNWCFEIYFKLFLLIRGMF